MIAESNIWMASLVDSANYSNGTLVSYSEGEDIFPCLQLEDEEAVVLVVDENYE